MNNEFGLKSMLYVASGYRWGWGFQEKAGIKYYVTEVLNGIIISFAQIPESIGFAFMANLSPPVALHAAWMMGLIASIFGGRPGIINGATGAFAAVIGTFVTRKCKNGICVSEGIEELFVSVTFAGLIIMICGLVRIGKLVQLIPASVMIGFCNGLAIVIGMAQLHSFRSPSKEDAHGPYVQNYEAMWMSIICIVVFFVVYFWNRVPKIGRILPASLMGILVSVFIEFVIIRNIPGNTMRTNTIGDIASFSGKPDFPSLFFTNDDYDMSKLHTGSSWLTIFQKAGMLAAVGILEELMTIEVVNDLLNNQGNGDQQLFAMGGANILCGLFGTMGGNSMIGLSVMNCNAGGRGKEAAVIAALGVFIVMCGLNNILNYIPMAGLAGLMFNVVVHTFRWYSVPVIIASCLPARLRNKQSYIGQRKVNRNDAFIILLVTVLCPLTNLATAGGLGIAFAALSFAWNSNKKFNVNFGFDSITRTKYYEVDGSLFYGSCKKLIKILNPVEDPPKVVLVLRSNAALYDFTALQTLDHLRHLYSQQGKNLRIVGISESCRKLAYKANHLLKNVDASLMEIEIPTLPPLYSFDEYNRLEAESERQRPSKAISAVTQTGELA